MTTTETGYGLQYQQKVSRRRALALALMYPLPNMGEEITVAMFKDGWGFSNLLCLQNISGSYFLASTNWPKDNWLEKFGVAP